MTRILAAQDTIIEVQPGRWRLLVNGMKAPDATPQEKIILEAAPGRPLRYVKSFATQHHLPEQTLTTSLVKQVVVGWSERDQAWHLGLVLKPELAAERQSRWCGVAQWTDTTPANGNAATQAGRALAETLDVPFRVITPQPQAAPRTLTALPIEYGIWTLKNAADNTLELVRASRWASARMFRMVWYGLWAVVYLALSIATINSELALPNSGLLLPSPQLLPYLGLFTAFVLLGIVAYTGYELFTKPNVITINPMNHSIRNGNAWTYRADEIESVYVSQVVSKRKRYKILMQLLGQQSDVILTVHYGEINLRLQDGTFVLVTQHEHESERLASTPEERESRLKNAVWELSTQNADTALQSMGVYLAQALRVPVWYDQRS